MKKRRTVKVVMYVQIPDENQVTEVYFRNVALWGNELGLGIWNLEGRKVFSRRVVWDDVGGILRKELRKVLKPIFKKAGFILPKGHPRRGRRSYERMLPIDIE